MYAIDEGYAKTSLNRQSQIRLAETRQINTKVAELNKLDTMEGDSIEI
jgi:hypothetical protein